MAFSPEIVVIPMLKQSCPWKAVPLEAFRRAIRGVGGVQATARSKRMTQQPVRPLGSLASNRWRWRPGDQPPTRRLVRERTGGRQGGSPNSTEEALAPGQARLREDRRRSEQRSRIRKGVGWPHSSDEGGERPGSRTQRSEGGQSGVELQWGNMSRSVDGEKPCHRNF